MGVRQSPFIPLWHNELRRARTVTDVCGKPRSNGRNGGTKGGTDSDVSQGRQHRISPRPARPSPAYFTPRARSPALWGWTLDWSPTRFRLTSAPRRTRSGRCAAVPPRSASAAGLVVSTPPARPGARRLRGRAGRDASGPALYLAAEAIAQSGRPAFSRGSAGRRRWTSQLRN